MDINNKRKHIITNNCERIITNNCERIITKPYKLYEKYYNIINCDKIELVDNHIYFDSLINNDIR